MSDFNVNEYLKDVIIEGNLVKLPLGQLDRKEYMEVKKKLELIGGKWKGGNTQGFVFEQDPKELLDKVCEGENINLKKEFQFFETPEKIADKLVYYADHERCKLSADGKCKGNFSPLNCDGIDTPEECEEMLDADHENDGVKDGS